MGFPPFAEIRVTRVDRALENMGLHWTRPVPGNQGQIYELIGDVLVIDGEATLDGYAVVQIQEQIDVTQKPEPYWYQYGLSFIDGAGKHQRREVHLHPFNAGPGDECVGPGPCHRHRYVGAAGASDRPHVSPCSCVSIEDALGELLLNYWEAYPPSAPPPLRT